MTPGKAYLTSDEIRPLANRSDLAGFLLLAHCYGVIALALLVFALWPKPADICSCHHSDWVAPTGIGHLDA